jgi:hypothetical protein
LDEAVRATQLERRATRHKILRTSRPKPSRKISASRDRIRDWSSIAVSSHEKTERAAGTRLRPLAVRDIYVVQTYCYNNYVAYDVPSAGEGLAGGPLPCLTIDLPFSIEACGKRATREGHFCSPPADHEGAANENAPNDKKVAKILLKNTNVGGSLASVSPPVVSTFEPLFWQIPSARDMWGRASATRASSRSRYTTSGRRKSGDFRGQRRGQRKDRKWASARVSSGERS